jgi:hypothetical protein
MVLQKTDYSKVLLDELPVPQTLNYVLSILQNQKAKYLMHKSSPLLPILSQIHPVHATPSYLFKISLNIIFLLRVILHGGILTTSNAVLLRDDTQPQQQPTVSFRFVFQSL